MSSALQNTAAASLAAWLEPLRADAARIAGERPMPTTIERPWKYLDISSLDLEPYTPAAPSLEVTAPPDALAVAFSAADEDGLEIIRANTGRGVPMDRDRLTATHYAALQDGVLVHVPAGSEAARPITITRRYRGEKTLATPHTLVVTGANSRVTVVDDYRSDDGSDIVALPAVEIMPGPGSTVHYVTLHRWGDATRVFAQQRTLATQPDSAVVSFQLLVGGSIVKSHIESSLEGRGASSELYGLCLGADRQHLDVFTVQDHIGPDTRSDLMLKSALYDRARAVYYGLTRVGLGAKNADANQENRNLLLSANARADSDPVLEILTSNVIRASHGATAGPVDDEQLFYLESRGIPHRAAQALLVRGFLGEVLARIHDETVREELAGLVEEKLESIE